jgi:hypothetical protein
MIACQEAQGAPRAWYFQLGGTSSSWTNLMFGNFTTNAIATQTFSLNTWYHLVAAKTGTSTQLYVNGVAAGSSVNMGTITSASNSLTIGRETPAWANSGYSYALPGYISVMRIYKDKGFSAAEVTQNYNALRGRYGI